MYGTARGWGGTCRGFCITDQITDQYAPYCSELRYAEVSEYRVLDVIRFLEKASVNTPK